MAPQVGKSQELLSQEIIAEACRKRDEILHKAHEEADHMVMRAKAEAQQAADEKIKLGREEAARRTALTLATIPLEALRMRLARLNAILESIHEACRRKLQNSEGIDRRETILRLAIYALNRMPGDDFVIKISPTNAAAFGTDLVTDIRRSLSIPSLGIHLTGEKTIVDDGIIIEDAQRWRYWDNRLLMRLERLWPELRRQIALSASLVSDDNQPRGDG